MKHYNGLKNGTDYSIKIRSILQSVVGMQQGGKL